MTKIRNLIAQVALAQSEQYANSGTYFKTNSDEVCTPVDPGGTNGENVIVDIEVALFDGERTIPRDGNFGYCIVSHHHSIESTIQVISSFTVSTVQLFSTTHSPST